MKESKVINENQNNTRNYSIEHYKIALSVDLYLHMLTVSSIQYIRIDNIMPSTKNLD